MTKSPSSTTGQSPSASHAQVDKHKKQEKIVIFKLSPTLLRRFQDTPAKSEEQSTASSVSSPAAANDDAPAPKAVEATDNASETNSTPAPNAADSPAGDGPKKRKAPQAGSKRSLGALVDYGGLPKPRGKPGPKKRAKMYWYAQPSPIDIMLTPSRDDGSADPAANKPAILPLGQAGPKLGPKANQGAINAGLRALDRSGKPCRKWAKKTFSLKSFTGVAWDLPSWRGNERVALLNGEESSDAREISQQSSSDIKPNESDTAMDSSAGDQPDHMIMSTPAASSPAPMPPQASAIAAQG